jgi:hypothetical protein
MGRRRLVRADPQPRPAQADHERHLAGQRSRRPRQPRRRVAPAPVPALLQLWWGLFLISWLVDRLLVGSALFYEPTAQARRGTFVDNTAIRGVEVLLGIVAVLVVWQVTRRQEARAAGLAGDRQLR